MPDLAKSLDRLEPAFENVSKRLPENLQRYLDFRFLKFLVVGVVNTLFGYSMFALFIWLGITYSIALILSTVAGVLFNFKTIGQLVFSNRDNALLIRFIGVYTIIYFVNLYSLKALLGLHWNVYVASALLVVPMAILSFILNKTLVFGG